MGAASCVGATEQLASHKARTGIFNLEAAVRTRVARAARAARYLQVPRVQTAFAPSVLSH